MTDPRAVVSAADVFAWLAPLVLVAAVFGMGCLSSTWPRAARLWLVAALVLAGGLLAARFAGSAQSGIRLLAWSCALVSVICSIGAAVTAWLSDGPRYPNGRGLRFVGTVRTAAVVFGGVAFTVQLVIVGIRAVFVAVDLVTVFPVESASDYGFGPEGLWVLGCLFASCGVALASTRERQLYTCQFLLAVMIAVWSCLLPPVFRITAPGGWRGTGSVLLLTGSLTLILALAASVIAWSERRGRCAVSLEADAAETPHQSWPGFRVSVGMVALTVLLLACYQLAVPVAIENHGFRFSAIVVSVSAGLAAWACLTLLQRFWSPNLADAAVSLASIALCGVAVSLVPSFPDSLAERYPVIFNAMMVGLALATAACTWLALRWRQRLDDGLATLLGGRLIFHAKRAAFLDAVLAVALGGLMAFWPRIPSIAVPDDTLGRVTAGFGANLFLLLVVLWSARRLKRMTFHVLTLLVVMSAAGFMIMRMLLYSPRFG